MSINTPIAAAFAAILAFGAAASAQEPAAANGAGSEPSTSSGATGSAAEADSGVGLTDEADGWIGQTVVGADGTEIGTLRSVAQTGGASREAGLLVVEDPAGGQIEIPLAGATSDGATVHVTTPAEGTN